MAIDLFGAKILEPAIEDKLVAFRTKVYSHLTTKQSEGKEVTILLQKVKVNECFGLDMYIGIKYLVSAVIEEGNWVHAIKNCASKKGYPMKYHGWLGFVHEEDLTKDIDHDREEYEGDDGGED